MDILNNLQIREIFHIEFLRNFSRKFKPTLYALKGGVNLRLFFKSIRYSEDMDIDVNRIDIITLRDGVMKILQSKILSNELKSFGIDEIKPQDMKTAKQTNTTQRFKIHLITSGGEDLYTKIEFSRREKKGNPVVESVSDNILRQYKALPLIISHYDINTAINQKIHALAYRKAVQARDIFDLYLLASQAEPECRIGKNTQKAANDNLFSVEFNQFRDTVVSYLSDQDKKVYNNEDVWDEIKIKVGEIICPKPQ